jgi:hypothetical protein
VNFNDLTEPLGAVFCDGPNPPPGFLTADCTKVNCASCTNCCDDVLGEYVVNVPAIREGLRLFYEEIEDGPDSVIGTADPGCNSCSNYGTVYVLLRLILAIFSTMLG